MLLKEFLENAVGDNLFKENANNSFKDVFPELPVIEINFAEDIFLITFAESVRTFKVFLTFIFFLFFDFILLTTQNAAPFFIASSE